MVLSGKMKHRHTHTYSPTHTYYLLLLAVSGFGRWLVASQGTSCYARANVKSTLILGEERENRERESSAVP